MRPFGFAPWRLPGRRHREPFRWIASLHDHLIASQGELVWPSPRRERPLSDLHRRFAAAAWSAATPREAAKRPDPAGDGGKTAKEENSRRPGETRLDLGSG